MTEARYLTREEAAAVCACHIDTIRRDERMGKCSNKRTRPDGKIEIPVSDLVAAGRIDPLVADAPLIEIVTKSRVERELVELRQELAVSKMRLVAMESMLQRSDKEVGFVRSLMRQKSVA